MPPKSKYEYLGEITQMENTAAFNQTHEQKQRAMLRMIVELLLDIRDQHESTK